MWVSAAGTGAIYTTGADSAEIAGANYAAYYYSGSVSDTSQITAAPSSTTIGYEKLACVRVSSRDLDIAWASARHQTGTTPHVT